MTNFAGGWIAGNAHIINPRTPVKHRETAARQPRNSRNTLCETRETRRETARDSRETAANLMRNRVANSLHLELCRDVTPETPTTTHPNHTPVARRYF